MRNGAVEQHPTGFSGRDCACAVSVTSASGRELDTGAGRRRPRDHHPSPRRRRSDRAHCRPSMFVAR
jgi:hypothetical protein